MESIWIGWEPREAAAFAVARHSIKTHLSRNIPVHGLVLSDLRKKGLYWRPTESKPGVERSILWDVISDAPMATEFSNSRFLVPHLAKSGWAMFMDCDMLVRKDLAKLFDSLDRVYAVYCVKHNHNPGNAVKMDGQPQTKYGRKNWSSVCIFNCDHPANKELTPELVNSVPGRDLHRFCWLEDSEIGELSVEWNWLANHSDPAIEPAIVHHTDGSPCMLGYENAPYAEEWRGMLAEWALSHGS